MGLALRPGPYGPGLKPGPMGLESPKMTIFEKRFPGKVFFRKNKRPKWAKGPKGPPLGRFMGPWGGPGTPGPQGDPGAPGGNPSEGKPFRGEALPRENPSKGIPSQGKPFRGETLPRGSPSEG